MKRLIQFLFSENRFCGFATSPIAQNDGVLLDKHVYRECDCCGGELGLTNLTPLTIKGSEHSAIVFCKACGLLQTIRDRQEKRTKTKSLSCDADWGNVRHGKKVRNFAAIRAYEHFTTLCNKQHISILDVGSSRGDFAKAIKNTNVFVKCVEPDVLLPTDYEIKEGNGKKISISQLTFEDYYKYSRKMIFDRREEEKFSLEKLKRFSLVERYYDYVNLVHTLEHASSAKEMLQMIWDLGSEEEMFVFVEVPNFEGVLEGSGNLQEFFIEKHNFHFTPKTLKKLVDICGFNIVEDYTTKTNISLLLRRRNLKEDMYEILGNYLTTRDNNRSKCHEISNQINRLSETHKVVIYGASQILDAHVKYGGLNLNENIILVDDYLADVGMDYNGKKIFRLEELNFTEEKYYGIVFANTEASNMRKKLEAIKNIEILERTK